MSPGVFKPASAPDCCHDDIKLWVIEFYQFKMLMVHLVLSALQGFYWSYLKYPSFYSLFSLCDLKMVIFMN